MQTKVIDLGYAPRPLQAKLHAEIKRFSVLVCHRRWGKTHFVLMEAIDRGLRCTQKNPQYAYIAPTYSQAKRIAWEILKGYANKIDGFEANESELRIDIPRPQFGDRVRIYLLGAENPGSLRGLYLDGAILDEFAEMSPEIWSTVIRPALSDRLGWGIFIGTPKGMNHFYDIFQIAKANPDWYTVLYKASETGIIQKSELEQARAIMSESEYEQEFECSFSASLIGAYYGKEMEAAEKEGRVSIVKYDRAVPVNTAWDLGIGDATAIWFTQSVGKEEHVIDYFEDSGRDLAFYVKELQKKEYIYEEHLLPHDAAARDLGTGKTRQEIFQSLGLRTRIIPKNSLEDGIDATRRIISRCWWDANRCDRGINSLKSYEKKWDAKNKIFSSSPLHNWASHGADAFRVFAMGSRAGGPRMRWQDLPRVADNKFDIFERKR